MSRKLSYLITLCAVAALAAGATFLHAPTKAAARNDNVALAVATKDGKSVFKVKLAIVRENGDVVDATNAAVAYASCTNCSATAIAVQVVLVTNDATTIDPTNLAIAVNEGCTGCTTMADAYQYVLSVDGPVHFTHDGSKRLADVRHALKKLKKADLSVTELQAQLDQLSQVVVDVLAHDLVPAGKS